jgi:siroheme synthase-like protein
MMPARPALPISLHVAGRRAVIVGEGDAAEERRDRLTRAGAEVTTLTAAEFDPRSLAGSRVVLCLDPALGERVAQAGRAVGALIYVHDRPDLSDFALPALARRGPITLAISTDGLAPALARRLRIELEGLLDRADKAFDTLVEEMKRLREEGKREALGPAAARLRITGRIEIDP